jgi:hypothetical protein
LASFQDDYGLKLGEDDADEEEEEEEEEYGDVEEDGEQDGEVGDHEKRVDIGG